jgi:hypothetical protein
MLTIRPALAKECWQWSLALLRAMSDFGKEILWGRSGLVMAVN